METDTIHVWTNDRTGEGNISKDMITLKEWDKRGEVLFDMNHTPISDNTHGRVDIFVQMKGDEGKILGVSIIYRIGNSTEQEKKLQNKFQEEYYFSSWKTELTIPKDTNWSYRLSVKYTDSPTDALRFHDRAETVFEGDILYKDTSFRCETPPLINYFLIPGLFFSRWTDPIIGFSIYFMICAIICASLIYILFSRWGEDRAFLMGLITAVYPSMLIGALRTQDEPLVVLFFIFPIFLILLDRARSSSLMIGIGTAVKMWTVLLAPVLLSRIFSLRERRFRFYELIITLALVIIPIILIFYPFYLLAGHDFTFFFRTYSGFTNHPSICATFWYVAFSGSEYYRYIQLILISVIVGANIFVIYRASKQQVHPIRVIMVTATIFFLFYFKISPPYYAFFMIIFLPAMTEDRNLTAEIFSLPILIQLQYYVPLSFTLPFTLLILVDVLRRSWAKPYSFDQDLGEVVKGKSFSPFSEKVPD